MRDLQLISDAMQFAAAAHRDQRRKDSFAAPYINHPIDLMHTLIHDGKIDNVVIITAAILHDTIEDTDTTIAHLAIRFGTDVAYIVSEVSDDKTLDKHERKLRQIESASTKSNYAKAVKIADKICNLRNLMYCRPVGWDDARVSDYFNWSSLVANQCAGQWLYLDSTFNNVFAQATRAGLVTPSTKWIDEIKQRNNIVDF